MLNLIPVCLRAGSVQARIEELIDIIAAVPENSLIAASELCISGYDFGGFFSTASGVRGNVGENNAPNFSSFDNLEAKNCKQNSRLNGADRKPPKYEVSPKSAQNPLFSGWIGSFDAILLERLQEALTPTKFLAFTHLTSKNEVAGLTKISNLTKRELGSVNGFSTERGADEPYKTRENEQNFIDESNKNSQNLASNLSVPRGAEPLKPQIKTQSVQSNLGTSTAKIYNEFVLLGAAGILHEQGKAKLFTPNFEQEIFSAGDEGRIVPFEFQGLKFGVLICFELRFCELWARLKGCDVVLAPALWGAARGEAYIALCKGLAIANNCYVVASSALDFEFAGVFLPTGELVRQAEFEPNLIAGIKANLGI